MEIEYGSILPSKTAYEKIGKGSTHNLDEVIAEFIDNSIEGRTQGQREGTETLEINVKMSRSQITVIDNARGMDKQEAIDAISLFKSKKKHDELGGFGVGMKSAALSVGNILNVRTGKEGNKEEYIVQFNINQWNNDEKLSWTNYPYGKVEKDPSKHGTIVTISDLRVAITELKISKLKKSIGKRYAAFIKSKDIVIKVNEIPCIPEKIDWRPNYPKPFEFDTSFGKITGVVGLMQKSSQVGDFGFNLFRNNRLIMQFQKLGISGHPSCAFIMGDINLDFVPVNQDKNKFRTESKEYEEAEKVLKESEIFKTIITASGRAGHMSGSRGRGHELVVQNIPKIMDVLATIYNRRSRKDETPEELEERLKREASEEKREYHRDPKAKTRGKNRLKQFSVTLKSGKKFRIIHDFGEDENKGRKNAYPDYGAEIITVVSNAAYEPYLRSKDKLLFVMESIAEVITELYARDNNLELDATTKYKDDLLKDMVELTYRKAEKEEKEA